MFQQKIEEQRERVVQEVTKAMAQEVREEFKDRIEE